MVRYRFRNVILRNVMVAHPERLLLSMQVGPKESERSKTARALFDPTCILNSMCEGLASGTFRFNNLVGI